MQETDIGIDAVESKNIFLAAPSQSVAEIKDFEASDCSYVQELVSLVLNPVGQNFLTNCAICLCQAHSANLN